LSPLWGNSGGNTEKYNGSNRHADKLCPASASLKSECIRPGTPLSLIDARRLVHAYVEHYNNIRTLDYFQTLWNVPQPWTSLSGTNDQVIVNPDLPQFPAGTQVALVRQMTLFDDHGNLVPAPITESVQIRVYRTITASKENRYESEDFEELSTRSGQAFYEITLGRPQLFANKAGGLRATGRDEREFSARADDPFDPLAKNLIPPRLRTVTIFLQCAICHSAGGINSLESRSRLLKPNPLQHDLAGKADGPRWWEYDQTINWKHDRYGGLLTGYWRSSGRLH
jgi:hypothetical protein